MLVGVAAALAVSPSKIRDGARSFFEGAGFAYTHIISLIVAANCFGTGIEQVGLADVLGQVTARAPGLLTPSAVGIPLAFAWLSGSGFAATQSLYGFFVKPAQTLGVSAVDLGALVSIAAAAGRTMSPVAAVTLMRASMTQTSPIALCKPRCCAAPAGLAFCAGNGLCDSPFTLKTSFPSTGSGEIKTC